MGVRLTHPVALHCAWGHWEEAVCEHSYPLSNFSVAWKGSGVPEFVVSEFLTPFCPARHPLSVPMASLFPGPSAGLRGTHPLVTLSAVPSEPKEDHLTPLLPDAITLQHEQSLS